MKRHALFVGVDQYADPSIQNLNYPSEDATELASAFKLLLKFNHVEKLLNPAHSADVVDVVKDMTRGLGPGDLFLFFFAGHGFRVKENHVLVCAKDEYADLEDEYAGLAVGQLKKRMRGAWDRMLILDACQNDIRATRGTETGATARDLSLIHELDAEPVAGCGRQILVTSCSEGQKALEVAELKHGLFTYAILDSITSFANDCRRIDIEGLRADLGVRMGQLISRYRLSGHQEPLFTMPANAARIILLNGASEPPPIIPMAVSALVVCPICGKKNRSEDTFKCRECGRDNLCLRHQDEETFLCKQCVAMIKEKCENVERLYQNGEYHYHGRSNVHQDYSEAVKWYRKAAELGYAKAQFMLGKCYDEGHGVERSELEAAKWWRKAADQGHVEAQLRLGDCYGCHIPDCAEDQRVPRDDAESAKWYLMAAEQGHAEAQYALGCLYYCGQGVPKDNAESAKWYRKAAEHGHAEAQVILGGFYEYGDNVPQDNVEAAKWYGKAAAQGNARAQYFLGELYYNGQGVPQDYAEAAKWYRKAVKQEDELDSFHGATCRLGELYDRGLGVPKDHVEASKWYGRAAVRGNTEALEWCRKAAKQGDKNLQDLLREHGWD